MGIQIRTITAETFSMRYFSFGSGEKTFVILPGLSVRSVMCDAELIAKSYEMFTEEYTVYCFDRREDMPLKYSICDMARDTAAAIREIGLKDICLFGASQGGMIAMAIAAENPDLVSKLVLGSSAARLPQDNPPVIKEWIRLAKEGDGVALFLDFGEKIYPPKAARLFRELLIEAGRSVTEEDLRRFIICAESGAGYDVTGRLKEIRCPVLILGAADDQVLGPDASSVIAEGIRAGRTGPDDADVILHVYDGYGHAAFDMAPDYKDRIMAFFDA